MTRFFIALAFLFGVAPALAAPPVFPGCAVPPATFAHAWYFDPANGDDIAGNGSQSAPWKTVQSLFSSGVWGAPRLDNWPYWHRDAAAGIWDYVPNAAGPVGPGDEIVLMPGQHGALAIGAYGQQVDNAAWITVAGQPGAQVDGIAIGGVSGWRFTGLLIQKTYVSGDAGLFVVRPASVAGALTHDIELDGNTLQSVDDATFGAWTQAEWLAQGQRGVALGGGDCVNASGNQIRNVTYGASLGSSHSLFQANTIDGFGDDGIDYAGVGPYTIRDNRILNSNTLGDGVHLDAIQGQSTSGTVAVDGVTIDGNFVRRVFDPARVRFPSGLQGIDAFDGYWTHLSVTNNDIATMSCHGISFASVVHGLVAGNTVVDDGQQPAGNCVVDLSVASQTHEGPPSQDVLVADNIATMFDVSDPSVTALNNLCVEVPGYARACQMNAPGVPAWEHAPGTYAGGNVIPAAAAGLATSIFRTYDPANMVFDLRLASGGATAAPIAGAYSPYNPN